jgi:hypothetical protein
MADALDELNRLRLRYVELRDEMVELTRRATDAELESLALADRITELEEQTKPAPSPPRAIRPQSLAREQYEQAYAAKRESRR